MYQTELDKWIARPRETASDRVWKDYQHKVAELIKWRSGKGAKPAWVR